MSAEAALAWYVYAVLPGQAAALHPAVAPQDTILPGAPVGIVAENGVSALVSVVPRALFAAGDPASLAADPDWVAARAASHHGVVAQFAASGPCLPVAFGTLFGSPERLRAWLGHHAPALRRGLEEVAGREEWAVLLQQDAVLRTAWLRANDPGLAAIAASAAQAGPGTNFLLERRLAKAGEAVMAARNAEAAEWLATAFRSRGWTVCREHARDAIAAWSIMAQAGSGAAAALAQDGVGLPGTGLALRVTGPWPPYAFARTIFMEQDNG